LKTIIMANGQISDWQAAGELLEAADLIVAANGGTHHCTQLGFQPDVVVGDLDSLSDSAIDDLRAAEVELIQHPKRKDATDLELALEQVRQRGAQRVLVLGAVGGRWDQSLANFHLIASPRWQPMEIEVVDGPQSVHPIHPGRELELQGRPGDLVSLIPFGGDAEGVRSHGLEYPLENESLAYDRSRGISNVLVDPPARISLQQGTLLCTIIHGGEDKLLDYGGH
jgi:thiamine pyrophosphokinase